MNSFHIDALMQRFPQSRCTSDSPLHVFEVVETTTVQDGVSRAVPPMVLYVTLDQSFPVSPPVAKTQTDLIITAARWESTTLLSEAVETMFLRLRELWGRSNPPSLADLPQLGNISDEVLNDLLANMFCFESFVFQLPYCRALRDAIASSVEHVEKAANSNLDIRGPISQLSDDVKSLQTSAREQADELLQAKKEATELLPFVTPMGVLKAFAPELQECEIAAGALADQYAQQEASSSTLLEEYLELRVKYHSRDLKRRAYASSCGIEI